MKRFIAFILTALTIISVVAAVSVSAASVSAHDVLFDWEFYYAANPDVARAFGKNPSALRSHYNTYGKSEGRAPSRLFDPKVYVSLYPDLKRAFGNNYTALYNHFVNNGIGESRQGSSYVNVGVYKANYEDLQKAFGSNNLLYLKHYKEYGYREGRNALTKVNTFTDVTASFAGKTVTLKSVENGKYMCADGNTSNTPIRCNRDSASTWETFTFSSLTSDGWVGIKGYNGKWLCANANYTNTPLMSTAGALQSWECYRIYKKGNDYYIKAQVNNKYLCVRVDTANAPVQAYASNASTWERFSIAEVKSAPSIHSPVPAGSYFNKKTNDYGITNTKWYGYHDININVSTNTPVYAPFKGTAYCKQAWVKVGGTKYLYSYGNHIEFISEDGVYRIIMAHLDRFEGVSGNIKSNMTKQWNSSYAKQMGYSRSTDTFHTFKNVDAGTVLGYVGTTGNSSGIHLHIEVYKNGVRVDPTTVFSGLTK